MARTPSEIARIFGVDRNDVKAWAFHFKEYLSSSANPPKGKERIFKDSDIPILAFIYDRWEGNAENSDLENIKVGLNREEYRNEYYSQYLYYKLPLFQEPPDELDENWVHGILINGAKVNNPLMVAQTYKVATDAIIDAALASREEAHKYDYAILYLCRHTIELYLKLIGDSSKTHRIDECMSQIEKKFVGKKIRSEFRKWLEEFNNLDKEGTTFRYASDRENSLEYAEFWVDLHQLKAVMNLMCQIFENTIQNNS